MEEMFAGQGVFMSLGFLVLGFFFHAYLTKTNAIAASKQSKSILSEAEREAAVIRREAKVQAKDAVLRARENSEKETARQRKDILDLEKRVVEREKNISGKLDMLSTKELQLSGRLTELQDQKSALQEQQAQLEKLIQQETLRIEEAANLSREEARKNIMKRMEDELKAEAELISEVDEGLYLSYAQLAPNSVTGTILRPLDSAGLLTYLPKRPGSSVELGDCYVYGVGYLRSRARKAELQEYVKEVPPTPDPSKFNVMAFHVALSIGELGIPGHAAAVRPSDLPRGFDYYAGGHVHRPFLAKLSELGLPGEGYLAYSGSTETVNYREAGFDKGFFLVRVSADKEVEVERIRLEGTRKFVVFEEDVTGLSPSEASRQLAERVRALDERGAVIVPVITGKLPPGALRSDIDLALVRSAAELALAVRPVVKVEEAELEELPYIIEEREDLRARAYRYFLEAFRNRCPEGMDPEKLAKTAIEILDPLLSGDKEKVRSLLEGLA